MRVSSTSGMIAQFQGGKEGLDLLRAGIEYASNPESIPLRLAITEMRDDYWRFELDSIELYTTGYSPEASSIFSYRQRKYERQDAFNAVMMIPTGIDCSIGGHAGDATPASRLLASICDHLIVHPNVVNASDINEQTENSLYVEGSIICRLLMGSIALRKVRSNRIIVITEARDDGDWAIDQAVNATSAARATLGVNCTKVVVLQEGLSMTMKASPSGRAVGEIEGVESLFKVLEAERGNYDAVALLTKIGSSTDISVLLQEYFRGEGPNPWGGAEAALTHTISSLFGIPSAHAPTLEHMQLRNECFGKVDPRKAAEAISTSFSFCVLKGLHRSPAIDPNPTGEYDPGVISIEDISCLVIPDGCVGLPTIAALLQGIPVIAVRQNTNLMKNDLRQLPFVPGQLTIVNNYLEAAGLMAAMKSGIHPSSVSRPLAATAVIDF